jgi:hypothetical protein
MTQPSWPHGGKARPGWKGVGFCCNYRCMVGTGRAGLYGAIVLIVGIFGTSVAFPMRYYIQNHHYWQPIIAFALFFSSLSSLMITHLTDPGIIPPRPPPPTAWLRKRAKQCAINEKKLASTEDDLDFDEEAEDDELKAKTDEIMHSFHSRHKAVPSGTPQLSVVYCYTCHNWRTPRAVHCSDCGVGTSPNMPGL